MKGSYFIWKWRYLGSFYTAHSAAAGRGCHERWPALILYFSFSVQLLRKLKILIPQDLGGVVSVTELLQAERGSIAQKCRVKVGAAGESPQSLCER